jgi:DTW domain-containing protein YfiP
LTDGIVPGREIVDREPYPWQPANGPCVLLYPDQSARSIEDWRGCNDLTLVVLDGTWRQTARARLRLPGLADLPVATLPEARPRWALRRDPRPGRVGTLEAVARALGVIEGDAVQAALARVLQLFFERTQSMRGR